MAKPMVMQKSTLLSQTPVPQFKEGTGDYGNRRVMRHSVDPAGAQPFGFTVGDWMRRRTNESAS